MNAFFKSAAVLKRPEVKTLRLSGPDRARFLNSMVTNDVTKLQEGEGCLAIKTNNKGRIEGFLRVRARKDSLEIDLLEAVSRKVLETLDHYIIMDDCKIEDVSEEREVLSLYGPDSDRVLGRSFDLPPHGFQVWDGALLIDDPSLLVKGYEIFAPKGSLDAWTERLTRAGAKLVSREDFDVARIEAGVPLDGRDLSEEIIPMEARLEKAISFNKGCYIGQEVIARGTILGHVNYLLTGVVLEKEAPREGTCELFEKDGGKKVGDVTSVVRSPDFGTIGLAYVRRAIADQVGFELSARGEGYESAARIAALPFRKAQETSS